MQYLLLIYDNEAEFAGRGKDAMGTMMSEYQTFTKGIIQNGNFKAGDALQPTSTATTVKVRGGKTMRTDGPFAETREQLSGDDLVEAKVGVEAIGIAARVPTAKTGTMEIRPIMAMS